MNDKDLKDGRILPHTLPNGIVVPAGLLVSSLTLEQHRARLKYLRYTPLSEWEEKCMHPNEVP